MNLTLQSTTRQDQKFSDLIEDIDIPGDPFYLKYYRSFHNHELDSNVILNEQSLYEEDRARKGALTLLP